ncbi:hypothetical protein HYZ99_02975 [Candidatus Peregrinibacteria bacterium]|nr:hypothetical protein [Candidatus Peregrinibacteria bacterium]
MSFIEVPNGQDPLLKIEKTEATASEQKAEEKDTKKPEQKEMKEQLRKPKEELHQGARNGVEQRIAAHNVRLTALQNQKDRHDTDVATLKRRADEKKEHLKDTDLAADLVTDTATAMQAPEGKTKPGPVEIPEGEDRQETKQEQMLAKGVDQTKAPEKNVNPEIAQAQVAALEQADVRTEQNTEVADTKAAQKTESADSARGVGTNQAGGQIA